MIALPLMGICPLDSFSFVAIVIHEHFNTQLRAGSRDRKHHFTSFLYSILLIGLMFEVEKVMKTQEPSFSPAEKIPLTRDQSL